MSSSSSRFAFVSLGLALVTALLCADARATTIIPMSDADLTLSSRAIVEGRVRSIDVQWNAEHTAIYTFVSFRVTRVIKGEITRGQTIVLKQIGGRLGPNDTRIPGAPYWAPRWRMLLFLNADDDGSLHVAHLSLGYFRLLRGANSREYVSRSAFGAVVVSGWRSNGESTSYAPRDKFVSRVERILSDRRDEAARYKRERGAMPIRAVPPGYVESTGAGLAKYNFLEPGIRWIEPDDGDNIRLRVNPDGAATPSGGVDEAEAVASVWSLIAGSSLRASIGDNTSACGLKVDGTTAISFGDCERQIDDPVNCTGVVGLGGIVSASTSETSTVGGESFLRAIEGDIIFNNGLDCLLSDSTFLEEVLTHEMGHVLGFGHSSESKNEPSTVLFEATMYYAAHHDGRGAAVRQDDEDAARFLYRGEGDGSDLAIATDALPDAPIGAAYLFTLTAKGSGPFAWSIESGELPAGLTLSQAGEISGSAAAEVATTVTFKVRDAGNFTQAHALAMRATASPAPFLDGGSYDGEKLVLTGFNLELEATVTVNETQIAPPGAVKFKEEKGKLTVKGSKADLNIRKDEENSASVVVGGQTSNTVRF